MLTATRRLLCSLLLFHTIGGVASALDVPRSGGVTTRADGSAVSETAACPLSLVQSPPRLEVDIVFDGPHFNSYRMEKLNHNILVKIPERHEFVVIVRKDKASFDTVQQMAGRTFCAHAPPNLATLVLLSKFDNPSRQPVIVSTNGWDKIYDGVVSGKCVGGVLPALNLKKYDQAGLTKIVFKTQAMPNQAFSAGPRVSLEDQAKIAQALASPDAAGPTEKLRAAFKVGNSFALASNQEYQGLAEYLRNEWGYY